MATSYKFIEATSVASLQDSVNKFVSDNPDYILTHVTFAAGTGFVATLEKKTDEAVTPKAA